MQIKLSAVIITFNEEKNLQRCLDSIKEIADEIVVIDSFSTDSTKSIADQYNVQFFTHEFVGHIEQKNWAKDQAKYNYILSLDADEALSDELKESIKKAKQDWKHDAYQMNRLTNYCGKWIRHSGWYPDIKTRLFDRRMGKWGGSNPHDKYIPDSRSNLGFLEGDLLHYSFYTREDHLKQIEKFSTIASKAMYENGKRSNAIKILVKPAARFIKALILRRGFLDGKAGYDIARFSAYANYLKYSKLKKLQNNA